MFLCPNFEYVYCIIIIPTLHCIHRFDYLKPPYIPPCSQTQQQDKTLTSLETSLNKHVAMQKETASSAADKDIAIMRLQSDLKHAQEKLEELKREVRGLLV